MRAALSTESEEALVPIHSATFCLVLKKKFVNTCLFMWSCLELCCSMLTAGCHKRRECSWRNLTCSSSPPRACEAALTSPQLSLRARHPLARQANPGKHGAVTGMRDSKRSQVLHTSGCIFVTKCPRDPVDCR